MSLTEHIANQAARVDRNPTHPQKRAGNYRKGHVVLHGLGISIENPRGSQRKGVDKKTGKPWSVVMNHHYGYIKRTEAADGDQLDVYLGPHHKSPLIYVIDQHDAETGKWDEHKAFIGFSSPKQVKNAYAKAFSDGKAKDRLGALHEMTVAQFKQWLKDGDTTKPLKRADGGRVGMADGGIPSFEDTQPVESGPPPFEKTQPVGEDKGYLHAATHGAMSGAAFNFSDELAGANAAGPEAVGYLPVVGSPLRTGIGAARVGYDYLTGRDPEATKAYEAARNAERAEIKSAQEHHPYVYGASEVAGSIPSMMALPEAKLVQGAGRLAKAADVSLRGAQVGAEYGALSGAGAGTDTESRVLGAAEGTLGGGLAGAVAPVIGPVAGAIYNRTAGPVVRGIRGAINPEAEAARRVATALRADAEQIASGEAKGLTPQEWVAAKNAGEPVTLAELGAGNTQALLRSAANTSPEGRALLEKVIDERFLGQSERVANTVRELVPGANARRTADQLVAEYDAARKPMYQQSFAEGDREITTPTIERLMGAPMFEQAMKGAITSGKDRAILEGYGTFNPGVFIDKNGVLQLNKKANGVPISPNLQYWDAVKRELDTKARVAFRAGDNETGAVASNMAKTLRSELDTAVPSYAKTRGVAADYFNESNALEAGRKLAGKKVDPEEIRGVMRKMKPDEKELFREGYASDWADRVIKNISDTRDLTKAMFNSPNERDRAMAVFGSAGVGKLQARMALETIMDGARRAMGNSTTARQLIEAGLAGGALEGAIEGGGDWRKIASHGAVGAVLGGIGGHSQVGPKLVGHMAAGAQKLIGKVDSRTAANVARLLTSDNPNELAKGLKLAASNANIAAGLKRIAERMALSGGMRANPVPRLQGPVPAAADQDQQRATGGRAERRPFDDGGVVSPFDPRLEVGSMPETNPIYEGVKHAGASLLDMPRRIMEANRDYVDARYYTPESDEQRATVAETGKTLAGESLGAAGLTMGTGAIAGVPLTAGEVALGAGAVRDPRMWHGISDVKLPKPIEEMSAVHAPTKEVREIAVRPADLQGGQLFPLIGDRSVAGSDLVQVNGYKFADPVQMQGGHGFIPENADTGAAWASGQGVIKKLGNTISRLESDKPIYGVYTAMGERSVDFSHHVSDTLSEMLKHTKIPIDEKMAFDQAMRAKSKDFKPVPSWPGVNSEKLREYLQTAPGAVRAKFAKLMDTRRYQDAGFPSVAEARYAVTDPRLLNEQTGAAGLPIAKLDPTGRSFQSATPHLSYDTNLAGQYVGGLPTSVPKEVMYPDVVRALEDYRSKLPGYKPTIDYLMSRTPKGMPVTQQAHQHWVDTVSRWLEEHGHAGLADGGAVQSLYEQLSA